MRRLCILLGMIGLMFFTKASAQVILTTGENQAVVGYLSGYYGVPAPNVVVYQNQLQSWQDVATALFIAKVTGMSPERIVNLRAGGLSFVTIANRYNVSPSVFVVQPIDYGTVVVNQGPPFGRAYGYWKKHGKRPRIVWNDEELENRVVLLTTSRFYHIPVATEVQLVQTGTPFATIIVNRGNRSEKRDENNENGQGNGGQGKQGHGNGNKGNPGRGHGKHEGGD